MKRGRPKRVAASDTVKTSGRLTERKVSTRAVSSDKRSQRVRFEESNVKKQNNLESLVIGCRITYKKSIDYENYKSKTLAKV